LHFVAADPPVGQTLNRRMTAYNQTLLMHQQPLPPLNRRKFLRTSTTAAALLGTGVWTSRAQTSPNSRIRIGLIGTGDRCQQLMREIFEFAPKLNAQITAVCDVWQKNLNSSAAKAKEKFGVEPRKFTRFGELLNDADVDAVVIATPDFSHAAILLAALELRKDVYVEKPMCLDVPSANNALDRARANKCVVQVGTQRRSDGNFLAAAKELQTGAVGKINRISAAMCVNQARWARPYDDCKAVDVDWDAYLFNQQEKPAFDPKLLRRWQLYRRFSNGMPGLWMTHYADAVHLLTGATHPAAAVALGGKYVWKADREHADTFQALLDYPQEFLFSWGMGLGNSAGIHFTIHGTEGTLDAENWMVLPDGGHKFEPRKIVPLKPDQHMENWLKCLRSRQKPAADIEYGQQHTVATVMAAAALASGQRQKYDAATRTIAPG
jgi:predicted dehydrogenase